jgi:hypothetical protein
MALTPAQKQKAYRERQAALRQQQPDEVERALLQEVERAKRGELSPEQCAATADKLVDHAMRLVWRAHELDRLAKEVRPPGWIPPGFPPRQTGRDD